MKGENHGDAQLPAEQRSVKAVFKEMMNVHQIDSQSGKHLEIDLARGGAVVVPCRPLIRQFPAPLLYGPVIVARA